MGESRDEAQLSQGHFTGLPTGTDSLFVASMMMLGWTTVSKADDAERLAHGLVAESLAACVQIEGPIRSVYRWEGKVETAAEYRLLVKFIPARGRAVEAWLLQNHPYTTPEWVVLRAEHIAEKYLSWARANSTSAPL